MPGRGQRSTSLTQRSDLLRAIAALLRKEFDEHARLISAEMGKPITEARSEVLKCALTCDCYADHLTEFLAGGRLCFGLPASVWTKDMGSGIELGRGFASGVTAGENSVRGLMKFETGGTTVPK